MPSDLKALLENVVTADSRGTARRRHVASQHSECGCLAGGVGSEKTENLALLDRERDIVDRLDRPIRFTKMLDFNHKYTMRQIERPEESQDFSL